MKYYRLTEVIADAGGGQRIVTQAFRICRVCRRALCATGGPGDYICEACLEGAWKYHDMSNS